MMDGQWVELLNTQGSNEATADPNDGKLGFTGCISSRLKTEKELKLLVHFVEGQEKETAKKGIKTQL